MKVATLMFCIIAVVITIIFASQYISFFISPPDLSVPDGLDYDEQLLWQIHTLLLEPATYLVAGLVGILSVAAGMLGGLLSIIGKRLGVARGLIIAAAGAGFFILIIPVTFLYLAAAVLTIRKSPKASAELVTLSLAYIMATFMVQWITRGGNNFLFWLRFEDANLLINNVPSAVTIIVGIALGALLCVYSSIVLYKQHHNLIATVFVIIAVGFLLMLTPLGGVAELLPFLIFLISLIALIVSPGKNPEQNGPANNDPPA